MDAPNKIYVEVCEDGIFAFPEPPFYESVEYIRADLVEQSSFKQEQSEVDLENEFADFLEKENAYIDDNNKISYYNGSSFDHTCDIYPVARHFYELGRNERKL